MTKSIVRIIAEVALRSWAGRTRCAVLALVTLLLGQVAFAEPRTVYLESEDGTRTAVADLATDGARYDLTLREAPFSDHFLSMRPFKCLTGPEKHWCHVPYPYENARTLSDDLTDLEYDLLFIWKGAGEYGINMWNGVYYKLERDGDKLVGAMHEVDMDVLSVPPAAGEMRPIREAHLEPADPSGHWLPRLVIE